jgi:hypothetical protein
LVITQLIRNLMLTEKIQIRVHILGYSSLWLLVHIYIGECNNRSQGPNEVQKEEK